MTIWTVSFALSQIIFAAILHAAELKGRVVIDGSSTVFPISEAIGEEFQIANRRMKVAVASSGTGGGFKKFCKGEADVTGASRPIEKREIETCSKANIDFIELPVAYDGIAIVVNKSNTWAKSLTVEELKRIWSPESKIKSWKEVRSTFPDARIVLFGPGPDSGTFDYFTKVVNGAEKFSRKDFTASESDDVIVKGVAGEKGALGYFGIAYYEANKDKLSLVSIDAGKGAIGPNSQTIAQGAYSPLSRPLFIYVSKSALQRPEVDAFSTYYMREAASLVPEVGYVPLGKALYDLAMERLNERRTGSMFQSHSLESKSSLADLMKKAPQTKK